MFVGRHGIAGSGMAVLAGAWRRTYGSYGSYGDDCRSLGGACVDMVVCERGECRGCVRIEERQTVSFYTLLKSLGRRLEDGRS